MNFSVHDFKSLRRCGLQKVLRMVLQKNPAFLVKVKSFHLLTSSSFSTWIGFAVLSACPVNRGDQSEEASSSSSSFIWGPPSTWHLYSDINTFALDQFCHCHRRCHRCLEQWLCPSLTYIAKCLSGLLWEWHLDFEKQNEFMLSCVLPDDESIVMRSPITVRKQIVRVIHSIWLCQR